MRKLVTDEVDLPSLNCAADDDGSLGAVASVAEHDVPTRVSAGRDLARPCGQRQCWRQLRERANEVIMHLVWRRLLQPVQLVGCGPLQHGTLEVLRVLHILCVHLNV